MRGKILLFPDTFTNYFNPEIGRAAFEVLEHLGYEVIVPRQNVCCGRPLYDYGMLGEAKSKLRRTLAALAPYIEEGIPVVVLEPGCLSVFRDEMTKLLPEDPLAVKLSRLAVSFAEVLVKGMKGVGEIKELKGVRGIGEKSIHSLLSPLPPLSPLSPFSVLLHGHCHQKALWGMEAEKRVLKGLGLNFEIPDTGCCGMAGAFGFDKEHYEVSMAAGERVLLPAVRQASSETMIVTDGFSCREQIKTTGRRAVHLAEVIRKMFPVWAILFLLTAFPSAVRAAWYSSEDTLESDPALLNKQAASEFERMSKQLERLKQEKAKSDPVAQRQLQAAEKKLQLAQGKFKSYKVSGDPKSEARAEWNQTMDETSRLFDEASKRLLEEKDYEDWKTQSRLEDLQYQMEQLKPAAGGVTGTLHQNVDKRFKELEERQKKSLEEFNKPAPPREKKPWEELKKEREKELKELEKDYESLHSLVKQTREPAVKNIP